MKSVPYVSEQAQDIARQMERRLQAVSSQAGIIFVSVKAIPEHKGRSLRYEVRLGIDRKFEEATGVAIIKHVFEDEIKSGSVRIDAAVYRGIRGAAINTGDEEAGQTSS